jgi:hypothetical protein
LLADLRLSYTRRIAATQTSALALIHKVRGRGILGSCARDCNLSYLATLYNGAGLIPIVPPFGEWGQRVSQETTSSYFDELAKGLANGTISRRQALRWMGGALVGGVLASIPGVALAQQGGNSACDEFCHENFSGRAAGRCASAGAHGTGPCYECTPGIGPGPKFIGCDPQGGICDSLVPCNNNPNCLCYQTAEGCGLCHNQAARRFCEDYDRCTTSLDCPTGQLCAVNTCCGEICIPPEEICPQ